MYIEQWEFGLLVMMFSIWSLHVEAELKKLRNKLNMEDDEEDDDDE